MSTPKQTLDDMAGRTFPKSKKAQLCLAALHTIAALVSVAFLLLFFAPGVAKSVVDLTEVAVGSIATLASIYCGAQAHTDASTASALGKTMQEKK